VILRLAVLIQYRSVTDTHTHRQTDRHMTTAYTALSTASRGKNDTDIAHYNFNAHNRFWSFLADGLLTEYTIE